MPTFLIDLIKIYDNEEDSEASHITFMPIAEEKKPVETFSPVFDDVTPNPQKGDLVANITLETIFLDQLGTQPQNDNSKNAFDAGEQKEERGQPKIDISMVEIPPNVDPSPTSPSRMKTPYVDKDQ
jgi:hypothetical protein